VVVLIGGVAAAVLYRGTDPATTPVPSEATEPGTRADPASAVG
jgi:hypothetical protein